MLGAAREFVFFFFDDKVKTVMENGGTMRRPSNTPIQVSLSKDESGLWFAWSDEVTGITGKGKTPDEAIYKFEKAYRYSESIMIHRNLAAQNVTTSLFCG